MLVKSVSSSAATAANKPSDTTYGVSFSSSYGIPVMGQGDVDRRSKLVEEPWGWW